MWKCFFFSVEPKPNQTKPYQTEPNQTKTSRTVLSLWVVGVYKISDPLGILKLDFWMKHRVGGFAQQQEQVGKKSVAKTYHFVAQLACWNPARFQAELKFQVGPECGNNQTKSNQPNQTKTPVIVLFLWVMWLCYVKVRFFSIAPRPNQTIPNWTKPNQNTWDCLILVSCWCIQNFRSLGYLKIGFLNVAPGGWVRAAAGAGGKKSVA